MITTTFDKGVAFLDSIYGTLPQSNNIHQSMDELMTGLKGLRDSLSLDEWKAFASHCIGHPLRELVHQDPFTARAFAKPRGYAGDAGLIDFIYQNDSVQIELENSTWLGKQIYKSTCAAPAARAVRCRRDIAADIIDQLADEIKFPHILSVACGHLDEARHSDALQAGKIGRFVGYDQDPLSLAVIKQRLGHLAPIESIQGRVKDLIHGKHNLGQYHLVYSLGLFDYLPRQLAKRVIQSMFELLNPGGRLLIANVVHDIRDAGYMESFMDWKLISRSIDEMVEFVEAFDDGAARSRTFMEENQNVVFLEIRKC